MKRFLTALLLCGLAVSAWAADTPISKLPTGGHEQPGDLFAATRQGVTYGVTVVNPPLATTSTPGVVTCGQGTACADGVLSIPIPGSNGNILYNSNGLIAPYILGPGLVATTSGSSQILSSTSTGGVSPAGPLGALQYNCNGSFCGYSLGQNVGVSIGALNVVPAGSVGDIQTNAGPFSLGNLALGANSLLGAYMAGTPTPIIVGSGLTLSTSGGITTISATGGGGSCPSTGIAEENGPCIIEENGPYIIEE